MGLIFRNPMKKTIKALISLIMILSLSDSVLASNKIMPTNLIKEYQKRYQFLRLETESLISHKRGIDSKKVKLCLKELTQLSRIINLAEREFKDDKKALKILENHKRAIKSIRRVFNSLYQFELEEDYLRKNIKDKKIFINAKGYIEELLIRLKDIEQAEDYELFPGLVPKLRDMSSGLISEIKYDLRIIEKIVASYGTMDQLNQWYQFVKSLKKRFPMLN